MKFRHKAKESVLVKRVIALVLVIGMLIGGTSVFASGDKLTADVYDKTLGVHDVFTPVITYTKADGKTATVSGKDMQWETTDPGIVAVAQGYIMGKAIGKATVTGKYGALEVKFNITVSNTPPPLVFNNPTTTTTTPATTTTPTTQPVVVARSLQPTQSKVWVQTGQSVSLFFNATMSNGAIQQVTTSVSFTASQNAGFTYDRTTGLLYGVNQGDYVLYVTYNGATTNVSVHVRNKVEDLGKTLAEIREIKLDYSGFDHDLKKVKIRMPVSDVEYTIQRKEGTSWKDIGKTKHEFTVMELPGTYTYKVVTADKVSKEFSVEVPYFFYDVKKNSFASQQIYDLAVKGVIEGDGTGKFAPIRLVSRAEAAKMLSALVEGEPSGTSRYVDTQGHWAEKYITFMVGKGYFKGVSDSVFDVNGYITGYQLATVLERMENKEVKATYVTPDMPEWAKEGVSYVASEKIFTAEMLQELDMPVNRAEVAYAIYQVLGK